MASFRDLTAAVATAAVLWLYANPSGAAVLFENTPNVFPPETRGLCDPCSTTNPPPGTTEPSMVVWATFNLASDSILTSLSWQGFRSDRLTQDIFIEIARAPYSSPSGIYFLKSFVIGEITQTPGPTFDTRTVTLPDLALDAGTYWFTIHGTSVEETHTWRVQNFPENDPSPSGVRTYPVTESGQPPYYYVRGADEMIFKIEGVVASDIATTPLPAAMPLFAAGLGVLGMMGLRRQRRRTAKA